MCVCDFHTHHKRLYPAILSSKSAQVNEYTSLEFHPWHLPENFSGLPDFAAELNDFTALGEIGLDRLRGPALPVQQQYLNLRGDRLAGCVRAFPELFALIKPYSFPWAIHGFREKAELLEAIWQRGGIVSFHHSITENLPLLKKLAAPNGKIAFESDDEKDLDLESTIADTMNSSGNPDLMTLAYDTFMEFVSYGK